MYPYKHISVQIISNFDYQRDKLPTN
jgi:hypothetical protein